MAGSNDATAAALATLWPKRMFQRGPVFCAVNYAMANCAVVAVDGGYVVVDTMPDIASAQSVLNDLRGEISGAAQAIVYTHGHWDHIRGTSASYRPGVPIWAHESFAEHLRAEYRLANSYFRRAGRQFGYALPAEQVQGEGIGPPLRISPEWIPRVRLPNRTFHDEAAIEIGGTRFELQSAPGETVDQIFVWMPQQRVLMAGDNIYKAFPNLYAIRGTPPRPVEQWIRSLDRMRRLQPRPEYLVLGHTEPVEGADAIYQLLTDYRDAIALVHNSVIRLAEAGMTVDRMVEEIQLPPRLREHPYLQELYGTLRGAIRGIYAGYFGWFDGMAGHLEPLATGELARRLVPALGGRAAVAAMVERALAESDPRWASWLADLLLAERPDPAVARQKSQALRDLARQAVNPLNRHWYLSEAAELEGALPAVQPPISSDTLAEIPIEFLLEALPRRLNSRSLHVKMTISFDFTDSQKQFTFFIRQGVGELAPELADQPDVVFRLTENDFRAMASKELTPRSLAFWTRVRLEVPGSPVLAPLRRLRLLAALGGMLDRP